MEVIELKRSRFEFFEDYFHYSSSILLAPKVDRKVFYKDIISFSSRRESLNYVSYGITYVFKIRNDKDLKLLAYNKEVERAINLIIENRTRVKLEEMEAAKSSSPAIPVPTTNHEVANNSINPIDISSSIEQEQSLDTPKVISFVDRFYQIDSMLMSNDELRREFYFANGSCMGLTFRGVFSLSYFSSDYLDALSSFGGIDYLAKTLFDFFSRIRRIGLDIPLKTIYERILSENSYYLKTVLMKYYYTTGDFSDYDLKELVASTFS